MKNLSDDRLEKLLTNYCEAEPERSFVFKPVQNKEKIVPFATYRRWTAAAASLVLVSVLSIALYFLLGNKINTPIAVAPPLHSATTPSAPEGRSDGSAPVEKQLDSTEPPEKPSGLQQLIESIFYKSESTKSGGTVPTTFPTEKEKSGAKSAATENRLPTSAQGVTEQPPMKPTENPSPSTQPDVKPTEPPVTPTHPQVIPTAPVYPPWMEPSEETPDPWEPEAPAPTEKNGHTGAPSTVSGVYLMALVDTNLLNDSSDVYCKVYDSRGMLLGVKDVFDPVHLAHVTYQYAKKTEVEFDAPIEWFVFDGYYSYVFYDENGKTLAQNQVYIEI